MTELGLLRGILTTDAKHIARDRFLAFLSVYAVLLAVVVRFGVPALTELLRARYAIELVPYYGLLSSFVALTLGATIVGIVLGFLLLEARETRVIDAISVSPFSFDRFLAYRTAMPMVLAVGLNPLCVWIAGIGLPGLVPMLVIAVAGVPIAGLATLALATYSDNRVQAFAITKIISGIGMLPLAAYFIAEPAQYAFGLFPPYWLFKAWWAAVLDDSTWWLYAALGLLTNSAWLLWMKRRFASVVHRDALTPLYRQHRSI